MTAALEGGEWSAARPGRTLPPGKTRYPFYRRLGGPQGRSGRAENLVPNGIRSRTVPPVVSRDTDWTTGPTLCIYLFIYLLLILFITHTECFSLSYWIRNRKVAGSNPSWCQWIFHWHKILPIAVWPWGRLSLQKKWVPWVFPGGKGCRCVRLTTYHHPVPLLRNLGTLTSWNPLGL